MELSTHTHRPPFEMDETRYIFGGVYSDEFLMGTPFDTLDNRSTATLTLLFLYFILTKQTVCRRVSPTHIIKDHLIIR